MKIDIAMQTHNEREKKNLLILHEHKRLRTDVAMKREFQRGTIIYSMNVGEQKQA